MDKRAGQTEMCDIGIDIYIVLSPNSLSQSMPMSHISVRPALLSIILLSHVFCIDPQATKRYVLKFIYAVLNST